MRHSKSGGSYGMPVKWCRGWRQLTFLQQLQSFRMIRRYSVNVTILPFSYPLRYFRYWCCPLFTISSSLTGVAFWVITQLYVSLLTGNALLWYSAWLSDAAVNPGALLSGNHHINFFPGVAERWYPGWVSKRTVLFDGRILRPGWM